jgi:hypothetical protein
VAEGSLRVGTGTLVLKPVGFLLFTYLTWVQNDFLWVPVVGPAQPLGLCSEGASPLKIAKIPFLRASRCCVTRHLCHCVSYTWRQGGHSAWLQQGREPQFHLEHRASWVVPGGRTETYLSFASCFTS